MSNKKQIEINVNEKIASLVDIKETLVCGNSDYDIIFHFDEPWEKYPAKTALFVYGSNTVEKVFEGDICEGIAIEGATSCSIGVFAGDLITTTGACINCIPSIRDFGKTPVAPTEDVYNQIMELLNKAIKSDTKLPVGGLKGQVLKKFSEKDYDFVWDFDKNGVFVYNNAETYTQGEIVFYEGALYTPKVDEATGIIPTDEKFWQDLTSSKASKTEVKNKVDREEFHETLKNYVSNVAGFDGVTVEERAISLSVDLNVDGIEVEFDENNEAVSFNITSFLPIKPGSLYVNNYAINWEWKDDGNGNLIRDGEIAGTVDYETGKIELNYITQGNTYVNFKPDATCIGLSTPINTILERITNVENSIIGVEEELQMINEGGIE
jgi:hypothetical protein